MYSYMIPGCPLKITKSFFSLTIGSSVGVQLLNVVVVWGRRLWGIVGQCGGRVVVCGGGGRPHIHHVAVVEHGLGVWAPYHLGAHCRGVGTPECVVRGVGAPQSVVGWVPTHREVV